MGIKTRRGAVALVATAATFGLVAPMASAEPGSHYRDDDDDMTVQSDDYSNTSHLYRVAGPSRISTAIKLMDSSDKEWGDTVIIARDDDFADALASGPLADVLDAPVLLSGPGHSIDSRTMAAIGGERFSNVILIGGTGVFTENAEAQLVAAGKNVERQRGVDRYETAVGIAIRTVEEGVESGAETGNINVYLATGMDYPDALAAGAAAADNDGVVLLTRDKEMDKFTYEFLTGQYDTLFGYETHIQIRTVGGQAEAAARSSIEDIRDTNSGKNRYETAVMLAEKYKNDINKVAITSGENYADGVTAAAWVANHDGALLLTRNAFLSPETAAFIGDEKWIDGDTDIVVVGGTGSVSQNVSDQLAAMMTW